ncbi:MAG TPA: DUF751 domain-containing protein [Cyanobacteria bacterium UBA11162]|nr:DUF751 domain-containing protein [Cyanobacteria bacterium UBA12227]HAX89862.1 DUF751 domain-containing protein [Cyanobacteria bacterium UBA11370]HBL14701.1 DUF751 domain-containing protein [Cyanobacteria bacterium UBA11162]HBY80274.1 DUF751 domain-containing protein [Cyanobacteria bacterium UBA11148]
MKDFFQNVSRFPRFLITISLGIFFALFERFKPLVSNPISAIALVGLVGGIFLFLVFTLRAMLGLSSV